MEALPLTDGSGEVMGVCEFLDSMGASYCGFTSPSQVLACAPPMGFDWREGDCDGDTEPNGADPAPCPAMTLLDGGIPDAGDAGIPDAGVPDAGASMGARRRGRAIGDAGRGMREPRGLRQDPA